MGMFEEMMASTGGGKAGNIDTSIEGIKAALARPKLAGLVFGDILVQQKYGEDYRYNGDDTPVMFVRYATEADQWPQKDGELIRRPDIIIARGIDKRDGEPMVYAIESTYYKKA